MLYAYYACLEKKEIPYFWNKKNNLLKLIDERTLENYKFTLKKILDNIEKTFETDPSIIAKYICKYSNNHWVAVLLTINVYTQINLTRLNLNKNRE